MRENCKDDKKSYHRLMGQMHNSFHQTENRSCARQNPRSEPFETLEFSSSRSVRFEGEEMYRSTPRPETAHQNLNLTALKEAQTRCREHKNPPVNTHRNSVRTTTSRASHEFYKSQKWIPSGPKLVSHSVHRPAW